MENFAVSDAGWRREFPLPFRRGAACCTLIMLLAVPKGDGAIQMALFVVYSFGKKGRVW